MGVVNDLGGRNGSRLRGRNILSISGWTNTTYPSSDSSNPMMLVSPDLECRHRTAGFMSFGVHAPLHYADHQLVYSRLALLFTNLQMARPVLCRCPSVRESSSLGLLSGRDDHLEQVQNWSPGYTKPKGRKTE
jgi:hypothetical protein